MLRIPEGKGYRVYFVEIDDLVLLLLLGGNKARQSSDIKKAKNIWNELKKEDYL
ncbi:addiction module killer protein [Phaeocystidibacter luteus]|uniref:Addiction module killer protein n=1 Tax=Phaeocystidibacter luteus TaxID=911197 RepID=A0A6N6RMI7_9FLAO|nr:addiction module killer protein [Phaeocystidibacter luteus]